jgi:hypothetical protein
MISSLKKIINRFQGKDKKTKNTYYSELFESFNSDGCVICRLLENSVDKYLENLLHEFTMDPVSRKKIRESFGYCAEHTAQLIDITENTNQRLSATIVAQDLASHFLKYCRKKIKWGTGKGIDQLKKNRDCPICEYYSLHEKLYISEFVKGTDKKEFLQRFIENSGICVDHLRKASRIINDPSILKRILETRIAAIEEIDLELKNFIKKFDYRNKENITDGEATAWIRFFNGLNRKQSFK